MKRQIISLTLSLALFSAGCMPGIASAGTIVMNDNRGAVETEAEPVTDDQFDFNEYKYEDGIGDTIYFLVVKNNSDSTVSFESNGTAKDSNGNVLGSAECSIDVLGPDEQSIAYFYFDGVTGIDSVDYTKTFDTDSYYKPVISNLDVEGNLNEQNATLTVTNKGSYAAQFVEAYALFFDADNNLIRYSSNYITDGDSEIKPGATLSAQLDSYDSYDHVEVYLTGRSDGSEGSSSSSSVSDDDFEKKEYLYSDSFSTMDYLVITNNSESTVGISGNATALDSSGNVIGAADCSIDVLAPGEQSIFYFYFGNVQNVDHVEYQLSYSEDLYYKPVISNLDVQATINDSNVVVTATNKGDYAAQFVQAYVLFFDASGNIVYTNSGYITDDDSEIKPGATLSEQIDTYESFDHVEVYLTGRADDF